MSNGGTAITSYRVAPYKAGVAQPWQTLAGAPGAGDSVVFVAGLTNGQSYTFRVAAVNAVGVGIWTALTSAIVVGAPTACTGASATPGKGYAQVSWKAPASNNGSAITGYRITPFIGSQAQPTTAFGPTVITRTIWGLKAGTTYTFRVAASNARGVSVMSAPSQPVKVTCWGGRLRKRRTDRPYLNAMGFLYP
jgi:hypothetical protein